MGVGSTFIGAFLTEVDRHGYRLRLPVFGRLLAGVFCGVLAGGAAHANPTGPTVAHGSAQFARPDANTLNVTTSSNAIINWQGFSIDAGELTRFTQPSASSAVLNRVTGSAPSSILGQLLSNGRVFLVNPHGIVFGKDAVVDTAGLVASTLGISDADFLAGSYKFDAGPDAGDITNQGLIKSGADGVFLLAPGIENSGVIRTAGGDLVLAAGRTITLTSLDLDGVRVEVQAPEDEALNLGQLIAERGAAGVFAGSIRNSGTVEANAVTVDEDGTIRLVAQNDITLEAGGKVVAEGASGGEIHIESESGTTWVSGDVSVRASEGVGGTIRLLGNQVGLAAAVVDASGPTGGGEVLVGGDESGEGSVPTADSTYVSANSTVSADALEDGDGGKVVVFAEALRERAGPVERPGRPRWWGWRIRGDIGPRDVRRFCLDAGHLTAPNGDGGEWLIDPNDIEIVPGGGSANIEDSDPFTSTDDSARLGIDLIIAALSGGQTVTVQTTESGFDSQAGAIDLNAPLDIEDTIGTNTLILDAHRVININEPISDAAGGAELNLVLDAGDVDLFNTHGIHFNADVTLRSGSLTTDSDYVHIQNGATMTLDGVHWQENSRHVAISSGDGDAGTLIVQNNASVDATSYINVSQEGGNGTVVITGGGDVTVARGMGIGDASSSSQGSVTVTGPGSTLTTDNNINVGTDGSGSLNIRNGGETRAGRVFIAGNAGSRGTVTVTGAGSSLTTVGTENTVLVGGEGTGTLHVLDGGLVDTLNFRVAQSGVGQARISGTAANGDRSRVIVSPANGKFSGLYTEEAGFARVGHRTGSDARLEILDGGLLRILDGGGTHGPQFDIARNKGSVGTLLIDGAGSSLEVIQNGPAVHGNPDVWAGPTAQLGRRGGGTTTIRNGGTFRVRGESAFVRVSRDAIYTTGPDPDAGSIDQQSVVNIESGGRMEIDGERARLVIGDSGPAADGVVTVTGSGSSLVTKGTDNWIQVGDEGTGTLHVLDGGLVETLFLGVGRSGVGRAVIRGVAADGTRSRIIVSPDNGKWSGDSADAAGVVQAGRDAGSEGHLEIRDGGLLRVRDGGGTYGPGFTLARFKGSVATLLIDGAGSSLEVIQNAPATLHPLGDDFVSSGPFIWLGRRGGGTTTVSNGGSLQIKGENAFVGVTRGSVNPFSSEPDTSPVNQPSVVRVESGGRVEIDGKDARMVIGPSGASVDSEVIVTGPGSVLELTGTGNRLVVGDNGGSGRLEVHDGGAVRYGELVVGMNGSTNVTAPEEPPPEEPPPEEPPPEEPPPEEPPPEEPPPEEPPPEEPPPEEPPPEEPPPEEPPPEEPPPEEPPPEEPPPEEPPPEEPPPEEIQEQADAATDEILPAQDLTAQEDVTVQEAVEGEQEAEEDQEEEDEEDDESEEGVGVDESGEAEQEELQPCPT